MFLLNKEGDLSVWCERVAAVNTVKLEGRK